MFLSLRHSGLIFCGCFCWALAPFAVFFAVLVMVRRKSGWGICVLPFGCGVLCLVVMICQFACDHLCPCWSFLDNSLFSCKDRALERDRPNRRKKNVRFQVPFFWGQKVHWNQASRLRASSVPTLHACCSTKRSCHFLFVARVFAVFAILRSHFWSPRRFQKWDYCSFTELCMRSQKWDHQAVPFLGSCLGSFFCIKLQKRNVLVSMKLCGLWRPEGQLRHCNQKDPWNGWAAWGSNFSRGNEGNAWW